jgi:prepilin-type N-terminal cleavage/methylation domain-containing protein
MKRLECEGIGARVAGRASFTLTELLVVVAIMGVLMVMTIPAFTGIMKGSKMRSAVAQVRTTLSLARQWAITHREDTYVVFATNSPAYFGPMALRAFGVCTRSAYVKEWTYLPEGVFFDRDLMETKCVNVLSGNADTRFTVCFPTAGVDQAVSCVAFRPDGRLKQNGGTRVLVGLSEGTVDSNSYASTSHTNGLRFGVKVYPLTGQFKVKEMK